MYRESLLLASVNSSKRLFQTLQSGKNVSNMSVYFSENLKVFQLFGHLKYRLGEHEHQIDLSGTDKNSNS